MTQEIVKLGAAHRVVFSPNGRRLASLSSHLSVWDTKTSKRLFRVRPLSNISRLDYSPTGDRIALKNTSGEIAVVNATNGKLVRQLDAECVAGSDGADPVFSQCGKYLVDGTWEGELALYSCKTGKKVFRKLFPDEMVTSIVRIKDGDQWFVMHSPRCNEDLPAYFSVWKWPFPDSKHRKLKGDIFEPGDVLADPAGKRFSVIIEHAIVQIYSIRGHKLLHEIEFDSLVNKIRWSPDGKLLAVVAGENIELYNANKFDKHSSFNLNGATDCDFSPLGDYVAVGSSNAGQLIPWEAFFEAR